MRLDVDSSTAAADETPIPLAPAHRPARPTTSFGARLISARTERGMSHDDVARETRVAKRYVIALENESIGSLPGGVYNRAYLRTYAAYLGLDADSTVRDYDRTVQEHGGNSLAAQGDQIDALRAVIRKKESQAPRGNFSMARARGPLAAGIALVVLGGGVWLGVRLLGYPAGPAAAQLSTPPTVVSDIVARNVETSGTTAAPMLSKSEAGLSDSEKEPSRPSATPVEPTPDMTAEAVASEAHQAPPSLSVNDSGVGTDIVDRELVGRSDTFRVGTRIVFWTQVIGGRPGGTIRHAWVHQGRTVATVKLPVTGANWRTHSQRVLGPDAEEEWVVEAQDEHGRVLARHAFRSLTSELLSTEPR